jgi:hypothetical protein
MIYKSFDENITRKHGIIIEGWPLHMFDNPSAIGSQVELNVLLKAWQTSATRFRKMTDNEHMAWAENFASTKCPSIGTASSPTTISPSQAHNQNANPAPPTSLPAFHTPFNIIPFESASTPQTSNNAPQTSNNAPQTSNNVPKRPWKTRKDKGVSRKRLQIPGANVFSMNSQ